MENPFSLRASMFNERKFRLIKLMEIRLTVKMKTVLVDMTFKSLEA